MTDLIESPKASTRLVACMRIHKVVVMEEQEGRQGEAEAKMEKLITFCAAISACVCVCVCVSHTTSSAAAKWFLETAKDGLFCQAWTLLNYSKEDFKSPIK